MPEDFTKTTSNEIAKSNRISFINEYRSKYNYNDVRQHFIDNLSKDGWELSESKQGAYWETYSRGIMDFRKDGYLISVQSEEVEKLHSLKNYVVSCSWGVR
jgi:hypothetical protein